MAKRISIIVLSLAIVVVGVIAFNQLHYWGKSVSVFNANGQSFEHAHGGQHHFDGQNQNEQFERQKGENAPSFKQGEFRGEGHGGKNHFHDKTIQLGKVGLFLAVFALFTVVTIYLDKFNRWRRKGQKVFENIVQKKRGYKKLAAPFSILQLL